MSFLEKVDPEIWQTIQLEIERQKKQINLIASENYVSPAILEAQGSVMTNKYAEGYPGDRWYDGCEYVDLAENLAIERAKQLFGAEHVNVQPHSGAQANMAAYYALIEPGDTILAMPLDQGGHLTHGLEENFSGRHYKAVLYPLDRETERIDYGKVLEIAKEYRPRMIVTGASAYPRVIDFAKFKEIADEVGAYLMADIAHIAGLVAAGLHPSPIPYADVVTTTTHKTLRGPRGAMIMCKKEYREKIDRAVFPGIQSGPLMHVIAAKAVAFREALSPEFKEYQRQIIKNAQALAEGLLNKGYKLVSGGTDNHLILIDLRKRNLTGRQAADALEEAGIVVNKNLVPFDERSPSETSGIRLGTPAVTTRGMKELEMQKIAEMVDAVLSQPENKSLLKEIKKRAEELCAQFPIYL